MCDCVLNFLILSKSKEDIHARFNITYFYGNGNQITTENQMWHSSLEHFPPPLNEYCIIIDDVKIYPKKIKIIEKIVEYRDVTGDYVNGESRISE